MNAPLIDTASVTVTGKPNDIFPSGTSKIYIHVSHGDYVFNIHGPLSYVNMAH